MPISYLYSTAFMPFLIYDSSIIKTRIILNMISYHHSDFIIQHNEAYIITLISLSNILNLI